MCGLADMTILLYVCCSQPAQKKLLSIKKEKKIYMDLIVDTKHHIPLEKRHFMLSQEKRIIFLPYTIQKLRTAIYELLEAENDEQFAFITEK